MRGRAMQTVKARVSNFLVLLWALCTGFRQAVKAEAASLRVRFRLDNHANLGTAGIIVVVSTILGSILAAVVGMQLLGNSAGTYFTGLNSTVTAFKNADTGDASADSIASTIGFALAVLGTIGLFAVAAAVAVVQY